MKAAIGSSPSSTAIRADSTASYVGVVSTAPTRKLVS
jgi:hypothetical protein